MTETDTVYYICEACPMGECICEACPMGEGEPGTPLSPEGKPVSWLRLTVGIGERPALSTASDTAHESHTQVV